MVMFGPSPWLLLLIGSMTVCVYVCPSPYFLPRIGPMVASVWVSLFPLAVSSYELDWGMHVCCIPPFWLLPLLAR